MGRTELVDRLIEQGLTATEAQACWTRARDQRLADGLEGFWPWLTYRDKRRGRRAFTTLLLAALAGSLGVQYLIAQWLPKLPLPGRFVQGLLLVGGVAVLVPLVLLGARMIFARSAPPSPDSE